MGERGVWVRWWEIDMEFTTMMILMMMMMMILIQALLVKTDLGEDELNEAYDKFYEARGIFCLK